MSVEEVDWTKPNAASREFARSALLLSGSIVAFAAPLLLFSIATKQTGTGGPWGVAVAAALCLFTGLVADRLSFITQRAISPLAALLFGTAGRLLPPLFVSLLLAAHGGGRVHLAFVVYLLTFYFVTLTLDTCWAIRRVGGAVARGPHR